MPTTRLFPRTTDVSGSDWTPFGTSPAHLGLSDGSDATGCNRQMSASEPFRVVKGTSWTQLPASSGVIKQVTVGFRGQVDLTTSSALQVTIAGVGGLFIASLADVPTTTTANQGPKTFPQLAGATWDITASWFANNGVQVIAYELYMDVEWYPVTAVQISQIY